MKRIVRSASSMQNAIDKLKSISGTDIYVKLGKDYQSSDDNQWMQIIDVDENNDEVLYRVMYWLGPDGWMHYENRAIDIKSFLDVLDNPMVTMRKSDIEKTEYKGMINASSDIDYFNTSSWDAHVEDEAYIIKRHMNEGLTLAGAIQREKGFYNDLVREAAEVVKDRWPDGIHEF